MAPHFPLGLTATKRASICGRFLTQRGIEALAEASEPGMGALLSYGKEQSSQLGDGFLAVTVATLSA